jgi:hypothetical protein
MDLLHLMQKLKYLPWVLRGLKALFGFHMAMRAFLLNLCYLVTFQTTVFIAGIKNLEFLSSLNRLDLQAQRVMEENEVATASLSI